MPKIGDALDRWDSDGVEDNRETKKDHAKWISKLKE